MSESINATSVKKVSKKALNKCFWNWLIFAHSCYNYERLQGTGFLYAMCPIIDELYPNDIEARKKVMQRHTAFFNTEVRLGSSIVGLTAAMEERIASGETELADEIWLNGSVSRNRRHNCSGNFISSSAFISIRASY